MLYYLHPHSTQSLCTIGTCWLLLLITRLLDRNKYRPTVASIFGGSVGLMLVGLRWLWRRATKKRDPIY